MKKRHLVGTRAGRCVVAGIALMALTGCTSGFVEGSADKQAAAEGSTASQPAAASSPEPAPDEPAAPAGGDGIPAGVTLPDEGGLSDSPETSDWTTDDTHTTAWLFDPCRPTDYPTDAQRTGFRTVGRTGPEFLEARQLAAYPDEAVATEVMAGFRRVLAACATGGDAADGSAWTWTTADLEGLGDDAFVAASSTGGLEAAPVGDRLTVVRSGSLVFLAFGSAEFSTAELDEAADETMAVAQAFVDSL